jgi:ketosteroid isomerase-like protein
VAVDPSRLADYIAIRELTARYNRAFDDGRIDEVVKTFRDDGVFETQDFGSHEGHDAIRTQFEALGYGWVHTTVDPIITFDGDTAIQECVLLLGKREQDRSAYRWVTTGRYRDTLTRTREGWRFLHRYSSLDLGPVGLAGE